MITRSALLLALVLPASAALAVTQTTDRAHRDPAPGSTTPRPERIVPPPQQPMVPDAKAQPRPEQRASIDQYPMGEGRVRITVRVIAAEPGALGKDPRLQAVESNLDTLPLRYGTFKLVEERTFELDWKGAAQMELPGSRSLLITPREMGPDGRMRVHLEVLGAHPEHQRKLHTDYSIARGGTLMVGGYRLDPARAEAGTLLIAITQAVSR